MLLLFVTVSSLYYLVQPVSMGQWSVRIDRAPTVQGKLYLLIQEVYPVKFSMTQARSRRSNRLNHELAHERFYSYFTPSLSLCNNPCLGLAQAWSKRRDRVKSVIDQYKQCCFSYWRLSYIRAGFFWLLVLHHRYGMPIAMAYTKVLFV